jgi:hypothetical protein
MPLFFADLDKKGKAKNGEYCLYWILYQRFVVSLHLKELFDSKTPQNAENRTVS